MKKILLLGAICTAMFSCQNSSSQHDAMVTTPSPDTLVYKGLLPAADCDGIDLQVMLVNDSLHHCQVSMLYLDPTDSIDSNLFVEEGCYEELKVNGNAYYKLTSQDGTSLYFLILNDSTLRMVNDQLLAPIPTEGMSYDLKLQ